MIQTLVKINEIIKKAFENGRLIILLGAGASFSSKTRDNKNIPLAIELAKKISDEAGFPYNEETLSEVYQAAVTTIGSQRVIEILSKYFKNTNPSDDYKSLVKLPLTRIYTLNIDDCFERAFNSIHSLNSKRSLDVFRNNDPLKEVDQFFHRTDLIKLNGDILNPKDGFIFSEQEYAQGSSKEPLWYSELARDYSRNVFLFIGSKLKEPLLWHQIEKYKARTGIESGFSYVLTPDNLSEIQKISLDSYKVKHIQGTMSDFITWFNTNYPEGYTPKEIITSQRPELQGLIDHSFEISLFDKVMPVSISSLSLLDAREETGIREFYKGFKPSWADIVLDVPATLNKTNVFKDIIINDYKHNTLGGLYLIKGSAGSGKSTALKQIALSLSKETNFPVYYLDENKHDFIELIKLLDDKNGKTPYFLCLERLGYFYRHLLEIFKIGSKAIFIAAENSRILQKKLPQTFYQFISRDIDMSEIEYNDVPKILEKIEKYGSWLRLSKMTERQRIDELYRKSRRQLLIGLLEVTSGLGFHEIIKNDYISITDESERYLIVLAGIATLQNTVANEITLSRALESLQLNNDVEKLCNNLVDIVHLNSKNEINTRHRLYIENLFTQHISLNVIETAIAAYISAFTVYPFPIITHLNLSESMVYKYLVNAKSLLKLLNKDKTRILNIYKRFEKKLEQEGLFLMQYGLALRMFDEHTRAYQMFQQASIAYPNSAHIEHALAVQLLILCFESSKDIAAYYLEKAVTILNNLKQLPNDKFFGEQIDSYPIKTLSEGHVCVLDYLDRKEEAKIFARTYYDAIDRLERKDGTIKLNATKEKLMKYALHGTSFSFNWR
ncbi:UNVERIFIED_CONTAM: SIR2 family protein [Acinetobacter baumannii]